MKPNDRRCISCRKVAPKEVFWRIVRVSPSRTVQLDKGMGRSAYLCPTDCCLKAAQSKNRLGRSLKASIPEEIYQNLRSRLSQTPPSHSTLEKNQTSSTKLEVNW